MSSKIFKQDGRILFFYSEFGYLREIRSNKKILLPIYRFFEFPTFQNFGTFIMLGAIVGLIIGVNIPIFPLIASVVLGVILSFPALILTATMIDSSFYTFIQKTENSAVKSDPIMNTSKNLKTEEIFEYYDSVIRNKELSKKLEQATALLNTTAYTLPIYADLQKKKNELNSEYIESKNYIDSMLKKFKDRAKEEEVLNFLNAA